jgi:hypothetical protein
MKLMTIAIATIATLISTTAFAGNLNVNCYRGTSVNATSPVLLNFQIANNASNRLISDVIETRSSTDTEAIPSFLVSQYKFQPLELLVETDDGSPAGHQVGKLQAIIARKKADEKARYIGAYKRSDAGRQLHTFVTCVVKELQ